MRNTGDNPRTPPTALPGFTLVELLVVVTLIMLLITIMIPTLQSAVAQSEDGVCRSQQRQVATAFISFSSDRYGRLPGNYWWNWCGQQNVDLDGYPYFGKEVDPTGITGWGHTGTVTPYLGIPAGGTTKIYKCPGLVTGVLGSGIGSNGLFDFSVPLEWAGANLRLIPSTSLLRNPNNNVSTLVPTFLIDEEDPGLNINLPTHVEMGFGHTDQMGTWHPGRSSNYAAIDGSVQHIVYGGPGSNGYDWSGRTPSGATTNYSSQVPMTSYASWNSQ